MLLYSTFFTFFVVYNSHCIHMPSYTEADDTKMYNSILIPSSGRVVGEILVFEPYRATKIIMFCSRTSERVTVAR